MNEHAPNEETKKKGGGTKAVLGGSCLAVLLCGSGILGVIFAIIGGMKSTDVYTGAMQRIRATPAVVEAFGTPITDGLFPEGTVGTSNVSGTADLRISVSGPKGSGKLFVVATRSLEKVWSYTVLRVDLRTERA